MMARNCDGFWRLLHGDLAALLGRTDLSWGTARVYLALADLTRGYGKERDAVSLGQIGERAGMERKHVVRALRLLGNLGLYARGKPVGQTAIRWVVWPPPSAPGKGAVGVPKAGSTSTRKGVPCAGSRSVPKAGSRSVPRAGTHQEGRSTKKGRAAKPPSAGNLVKGWAEGLKDRDIPFENRGKVAGAFKRMLGKGGASRQEQLTQAIKRWFGADRGDFGIELFEIKINGGDKELLGRSGSSRKEIEEYARQLEANGQPEEAARVRAQAGVAA